MTPLVYIAGPYSADPERCVAEALDAQRALMDAGVLAVVPHLSHYAPARPYEDWMRLDLALVERCDLVLRLPGVSPGADRETAHARTHGLPVFYDAASVIAWALEPGA